jgi:serine/threonine protein kinase
VARLTAGLSPPTPYDVTVQGQVIADRYQLEREIGKGAMGSVWLSRHLTLGTPVAVKLIAVEAARCPDSLARFAREAQLAARIRSRHVVQVLDHGHHNDLPFIVMECLEGESLRARLDTAVQLGKAETTTIVRHVARALSHAHGVGLVHRDIKPENVFITAGEEEDEKVYKVLDFGVAKVTDELAQAGVDPTRTGAMLGTPYYLSPEQARGLKTLDFRSDLWALGVLAFECLAGKLPFAAPALGPLIAQITMAPIPVLSQTAPNAGITPQLDEWMARALCRDPQGRFSSAKEMAQAFAAATGVGASMPREADSAVMPAPLVPGSANLSQNVSNGGVTALSGSGNELPGADDLAKTAMLQDTSDLNATMALPDGYESRRPTGNQWTEAAPGVPAETAPGPAAVPSELAPTGLAPTGLAPTGLAPTEPTPGKPRNIDSLIREPWPEATVPMKSSAAPIIVAAVAGALCLGGVAAYFLLGDEPEESVPAETAAPESTAPGAAPSEPPTEASEAPGPSSPPPDPSASSADGTTATATPPSTVAPPATGTATTTKTSVKPVPTAPPPPTGTWKHRETL